MVNTPWGDATQLRAKKLRPGGGARDARTEASQRERIFAAVVATVAEKGYEATTVADLSDLSGVSKSSYYEHFDDTQAGFEATIEAIVAQPAAAKLCFVEIYAAGAPAVEILDRAVDELERLMASMFDQV